MKHLNSQKGIAPIILVLIFAVIAVGVGGAQYFKKQQAKQVAKSSVADETASWKTYTNTEYGFSIKYPNSLYPTEHIAPVIVFFEETKYIGEQPIHRPSITIEAIATGLTQKEWIVKNNKNTIQVQNDKKTAIEDAIIGTDNIPSIKFYSSAASSGSDHTIVKVNGNSLIDISLNSSPNGEISSEIYNQMLSTFKFTDKYQTVDLKDILKYSDSHEKNSFVKTNGKIVNLAYGNFRDFNIVLSDGNNNYILVTISHPDVVSTFSDIISTLNKDDKIEVNGLAIFTSRETLFNATEIGAGKNLLSVNQNLPDRIGAITVTGAIQKLK